MNKKKWSIAKTTLALLLCLQILTVSIILLVSHFWGEDAYLKHVRGLMNTVATESVQSVERLLLPAEHLVITSRALMETKVVPTEVNTALERYFFENIKEHPNFAGMYFGWANGDFLYVSHSDKAQTGSPFFSKYITSENGQKRRFVIKRNAAFDAVSTRDVNGTYDPRDRDWYKALKKGGLRWTNPYLYYTSKTPGITVSIPVLSDSGEPIGVLGIDIEISNLSHYLSKNQLSLNSSAFIASKDSRVVAHTDVDSLVLTDSDGEPRFALTSMDELDSQVTEQALKALAASGKDLNSTGMCDVVFDFEDEPYHVVFHSYRKQGLDWTVVVTAPESDFIGDIREAQFWRITVAVCASFLITLCAFFLALYFLRPVRELQESVLRDPLIGLYNRRALTSLGDGMVKESHRQGHPVSVAMIDIDHFKNINDTYGHPAGDEVLVSISQRMLHALQKSDVLVRYGGEEFALLLFDADLAVAKSACERIRRSINSDDILTDVGSIAVTISVGVVEIAEDDDYVNQSLSIADQALYMSKRQGRNRVSTQHDL
jgi:diguanylate cyclase (GGDEF)-like protein